MQEVQEKWNVYFILPTRSSNGRSPAIPKFWKPLVGQNFLEIEDASQIVPRIAAEIGAGEGMSEDDITTDLTDMGIDARTVAMVKASISGRAGAGLAKVSGDLVPSSRTTGVSRL